MKSWCCLPLAGLLAATPADAGHDWVGIDLCRTYPERMPPALAPVILPQGDSREAQLLGRYCGQCHYPPGPGQHTAPQWAEVMARMTLLMGVTARLADPLRPIEQPSVEDRARLLAYLERYALRPLAQPEAAPPAYRRLCGDCHALPGPVAYADVFWPVLLARMDGYRATMGRAPADPRDQAEVETYLGVSGVALAPTQLDHPQERPSQVGRWLALGPLFILAFLGVGRWWLSQRRRGSLDAPS